MHNAPSYDDAVARLQAVLLHIDELPDLRRTIEARDEVQNRYKEVFAPEHLPDLTAAEFRTFLLDENNMHWSGLYRRGSEAADDIELLRRALTLLLYGAGDIASRFTEAVGMVTGMGRAVASALLLVVHPERFGVWNGTSEGGLKRLGLWPEFDRGTSLGKRYEAINEVLRRLAQDLKTDLWSLDALWWGLDVPVVIGPEPQPSVTTAVDQTFGLERHLQYFLWDNWERTSLGKEWVRYREAGNDEAGFEYSVNVGRIDLLARHKTEPRWLVIELKRGQTGDATVGQVLRYMGWVKRHLAQSGETVQGLIIARDPDPGLQYALEMVDGVDYLRYEVQFSLHPIVVGRGG